MKHIVTHGQACRTMNCWNNHLLGQAVHGCIQGDTTTIDDFQVIAKLRESEE